MLYRKSATTEIRPYVPGENMDKIGVSQEAQASGSPKEGDMIASDPRNAPDQWLITKAFFEANYVPLEAGIGAKPSSSQ